MSNHNFPFAVRLIGFASQEEDAIQAIFEERHGKGYGYFRLDEDNLQDPDLYIVNADELKALASLSYLRPSDVRPALLIGKPQVDFPYPRVARPLDQPAFFHALDDLVEKRADALSKLEASDIVAVPERRRKNRLDLDLTDPAEYQRLRTRLPTKGEVLVIDKNPAFRDYLADLLARSNTSIIWTSDELQAIDMCKRQAVAVVLINTSTPGVDPYRLCWAVKEKETPENTRVIFLVSKPFVYDLRQARHVGVDGFLNKPLASRHVISALKKFMPFLK